jgi:hypothetical protein
MVHDFVMPLFVENNKKLLFNGKIKHLEIIKLELQTYNCNPIKKTQPNTIN